MSPWPNDRDDGVPDEIADDGASRRHCKRPFEYRERRFADSTEFESGEYEVLAGPIHNRDEGEEQHIDHDC